MINYNRVAKAIRYINKHATEQPNLDDIAEAVHLSPGVTPKEFLQYLNLNHAKELLEKDETIEETTFQTGLSSSSRLHDLFIKIEGMTRRVQKPWRSA